jgi:hypothetical protein
MGGARRVGSGSSSKKRKPPLDAGLSGPGLAAWRINQRHRSLVSLVL